MAPVRIQCPGCDSIVRLRSGDKRKQMKCPFCGTNIRLGDDLPPRQSDDELEDDYEDAYSDAEYDDEPEAAYEPEDEYEEEFDERPRRQTARRKSARPAASSAARTPRDRPRRRERSSSRSAPSRPSNKSSAAKWIVIGSISAAMLMMGIAAIVYVVRQTDEEKAGQEVAESKTGDQVAQADAANPNNAAEQDAAGGLVVPFPGADRGNDPLPGEIPGQPEGNQDDQNGQDQQQQPPKFPGRERQPDVPNVPAPDVADLKLADRLRYNWQRGRQYKFTFTVQAETGTQSQTINGNCTYSVGTRNAGGIAGEPEMGTGTAFVVGADGLLATCAHVVEGSTKVEVDLGAKTYDARVLAVDDAHDLALIRINAQNLPTLRIADSEQVELAQEVRAVGYPLTDVLGNNVKVTRGSVSGLNQDEERGKLFQVDAAINPGNSGGPVVNESGAVIGIASSKLMGPAVTKVGFAVPSNQLVSLLNENNLKHQAAGPLKKLDGPSLARAVVPSIGLVTVTIDPNHSDNIVLNYNGQYTQSTQQNAQALRFGFPSGPQRQTDRGQLVTDRYGRILELESEASLPFLMGQLPALIIEPLSRSGKPRWSIEHQITVNRTEREEDDAGGVPFGPPGMRGRGGGIPRGGLPRGRFGPRAGFPGRFGGNPFADQQPKEKVIELPAVETSRFQLLQKEGDVVVINKNYHLETNEPGNAALKMEGAGHIRFNAKLGVPESIEFKAQISRTLENNTEMTIPVRFNATLQNPDEQALEVPGQVPNF